MSDQNGNQKTNQENNSRYISIAQGDQLGALWPPRGAGWGGWEGDARGRGYGDICIHIADSLCYTAATNTTM